MRRGWGREGIGRFVAGWGVIVGSAAALVGCNEVEFTGDAPRHAGDVEEQPPIVPGAKALALQLPCAVAGSAAGPAAAIELAAGESVTASWTGELCPKAVGAASVLFVVDYSGSMGRHGDDAGRRLAGNDPQAAGGCGRLAAARAVLDRVNASRRGDDDSITVGMIPFAGDVLADRVIAPRPLAEFAGLVTAETFCSYVVQSSEWGYAPRNPGGVDGAGVDASTNYAAAFTAAAAMGAELAGALTAYFVSDGLPTSGGADPTEAAVAAGAALRRQLPELTLNGLLLGADGAAARHTLEAVVGAPERVRVAASAAELATEILKFPDPAIDPASVRATLVRGGGEATEIKLKSLDKPPESGGAWRFATEAAPLAGSTDAGGAVSFEISARTTAGAALLGRMDVAVRRL